MGRGRPDYDVWGSPARPMAAKDYKFYTSEFSVPANTADSSPVSQDIVMVQGTVNRVNIIIPPGHAALAGLQIWQNGSQLIPVSGWLKGNGDNLMFDIDVTLTDATHPTVFKLVLKGYNDDDTYSHTFYVRAWLLEGVE